MHTGSTAEERRAPLLASSKLPPAEIPARLPVPRMPSRSDVEHWSHELSQSSLASNDSGYTQQPWLPEDLVLSCMLCKRPFHLMRWTHHCRDCGGVFCHQCSSHRAAADAPEAAGSNAAASPTIRLCDICAFSANHKHHLGCENPFACPRCAFPATLGEAGVYARQLSRVLISCSLPSVGWCGVGLCCTSLADRVAEAQPPRQRTSAGGISPVGAAVLSDTGGTRGGWV